MGFANGSSGGHHPHHPHHAPTLHALQSLHGFLLPVGAACCGRRSGPVSDVVVVRALVRPSVLPNHRYGCATCDMRLPAHQPSSQVTRRVTLYRQLPPPANSLSGHATTGTVVTAHKQRTSMVYALHVVLLANS